MATYEVPYGHVGVHEIQLTPDEVDIIRFEGVDLNEVEILTNGTGDIYVTFGENVTPEYAGTMCYRISPGVASSVFTVRTSGPTVVKLLSLMDPIYSVSRT
jgi:hypothetical protein